MSDPVTLTKLADRVLDVVDTLDAPNPDLTTVAATLEWVGVAMLAIAQQTEHDGPPQS